MSLYECTFITRQDIPMVEVKKLADNFSKIVADNGGKVVKVEQWGLRDFAYPIKKTSKGYYTLLGIEAPIEAINELDRRMGLNEAVLRNVFFKVDEISQNPSPILRGNDSPSETDLTTEKETSEVGEE